MKTDTTFIWAYRIIELYTITVVGLHLTFIIHPRHTESEDTIRFYQSFYDFSFFKFRMLIVYIFDRKKNFLHCLKIFRFTGMLSLQRGHDFLDVHDTIF